MSRKFAPVMMHAIAIMLISTSIGSAQQIDGVARSADATMPLRAGDEAPEVSVTDIDGETVPLKSLYRDKPLVLVFFRGGWCPICTRHTGELIKVYPQIKSLGAELVGISPDSTASSKKNATENEIPFPIFSDADVEAACAFGLAFQVDPATRERYKGFGIDLEKASGRSHHALPVPAIYIVNPAGEIVFAHSDADYRRRLDATAIIRELRKR